MKHVMIRQCGPVLTGIKPAALFPLDSRSCLDCLSALLPRNITMLVLRETSGRPLVLLYEKTMLEKTLLCDAVRCFLSGCGYPAAASQGGAPGSALSFALGHLQRRFAEEDFPHEVGLFLGYPVEDVSGFVRHKGKNYKLCGYWKVYGNVEEAQKLFHQYDLCRERMKTILTHNPAPSGARLPV